MSNSGDANVTAQEQQQQEQEQEQEQDQDQEQEQQSEEWETMARAWLCSFPEPKEVSMAEVEAWIDSNLASLPEGLRSMPRPDLCHRLISFQNCMRLPNQVLHISSRSCFISLHVALLSRFLIIPYLTFLHIVCFFRKEKQTSLIFHTHAFSALISGFRFILGWRLWIRMRWLSPRRFLTG